MHWGKHRCNYAMRYQANLKKYMDIGLCDFWIIIQITTVVYK